MPDRGDRGSLHPGPGAGRERSLFHSTTAGLKPVIRIDREVVGRGIPGPVGGVGLGNAGSKYGAIGPRVLALELLRPEGQLERVVPSGSFFGYRHSLVGDSVVLRVELSVEPGDRERVGRRTQDIVRERNRTQPGWVGNAGCVFQNPPGASAGRLIDDAGCKGLTEGRIRVSRRHANFFENVGGGRAESVQRLIDRVRKRVRRACGAELELEVRELFTQASTPDNARMVRMVLSGYVSCPESDHAIAMQASVDIGQNRLSQIVAAYQQALNEVSRQLVTQLANACKVTDPADT